MRPRVGSTTFQFGDLFGREFGVKIIAKLLEDFILFLERQLANFFQNLRCTHGNKLNGR